MTAPNVRAFALAPSNGEQPDTTMPFENIAEVASTIASTVASMPERQAVDWGAFWSEPDEPREYLVEPIIARGEIVTIFAPHKVGKSLLALELAAALATGREVLGHAHEPMHVVYVDQEQTPEDWRERLRDMGYGPDDDLSNLHVYVIQSWPPFDTAEGGKALLEVVHADAGEVVIIDTVSKFLSGEENSADTMRSLYRHTLLPLKQASVSALALDHAGKDLARGTRGSSAKGDDVDTIWQMTTRGRDGLTLRRTHSRRRHSIDLLYLNREAMPFLCHVTETVDERAEELIEVALTAIRAMAPEPDVSARQIAEQLRKDGRKFRDETVREAVRRYRADVGGEL